MRNLKTTDKGILEFDPITHNLVMADDQTYPQQQIAQKLKWFKAEWFEDTTKGIDWFNLLLGQVRPDLDLTRAILLTQITSIAEVDVVTSLTIEVPPSSDTALIKFTVKLKSGEESSGVIEI